MSSPSVPAPITTTGPSANSGAWWAAAATAPAAWTAHAVGSIITAASSERSSGTAMSWSGWASISSDQPPPVSQQNPDCRPGSRWPKATRSQRLIRPSAQASHTGSMPRMAQCSTGMSTARPSGSPSRSTTSPTTSWPGTNGKDTIGSK